MNKSDLDSYVSELCSKIASKSDRKAAKEELYDHLMSHYEECISKGHSEEEAVETAVNSLGDKLDIKYQIAESYNRKHIGYKIAKAMLVAFLAFIGLIVLSFSFSLCLLIFALLFVLKIKLPKEIPATKSAPGIPGLCQLLTNPEEFAILRHWP